MTVLNICLIKTKGKYITMIQYYVYMLYMLYMLYMMYLRRGKEQSLPESKQYLGIYQEWLSRTTKLG
jgi:hypothetical protein